MLHRDPEVEASRPRPQQPGRSRRIRQSRKMVEPRAAQTIAIPFTQRAKRGLELVGEEARSLGTTTRHRAPADGRSQARGRRQGAAGAGVDRKSRARGDAQLRAGASSSASTERVGASELLRNIRTRRLSSLATQRSDPVIGREKEIEGSPGAVAPQEEQPLRSASRRRQTRSPQA